jgi:TP901 family phage tail tape measure protein
MAKSQDEYVIKFGIEGTNELSKLQIKLTQANKKLADFNKKIKDQKGASGSATQQNKKLRKTVDDLKNSIKLQNAALDNSTKKISKHAKATGKASKAKSSLNKGLLSGVKNFAKAAAAITAVIAVMSRLIRFITESVKSFAKFEKGIINVTTLLGERETGLFSGQLFQGGIKLSKDYGFALNDVTKAMFDSVSAGVEAGEALNFLNEASTLAVAGATDLKSATLGLTTAINAYGLETESAADVASTLFNTQKFGVTTVEELSKAIGVVVPFAAASGVSLKELGATIAVTTRTGLDAAKSVTALRAAISQMQKPAAESRDLFIKYGIPIGSAQLKAVGFTEAMRRLNVAFKDSPAAIEQMFGNVRGLTAIFSIAGDNADEYHNILERLEDTTESFANVQKAKNDLLDSTEMRLSQLSTSWEAFKVSFGDTNFYKNVIGQLTSLTDLLKDVFDGTDASNVRRMFEPYMEAFNELSQQEKFEFMNFNPVGIESLDEVPKKFQEMFSLLEAAQTEFRLSGISFDELSFGQLKVLTNLGIYQDELDTLLAREKKLKDKKAAEDKARDKQKSLNQMAYQKIERNNRLQLQLDIAEIEEKAFERGDYANTTQMTASVARLKSLRTTKRKFLELGIEDEMEFSRLEVAIAKEVLKQKKLQQTIERQDNQEFDELEIRMYTNLAKRKRDIALSEAEHRTMTNRDLTRDLLKTDIEYFEELLELTEASELGFRASGQTKQQIEEKLTNAKIQLLKLEEDEEGRKRKIMTDLTKKSIDALSDHREKMAEVELENFERRMDRRKAMLDQEAGDGLINQREKRAEEKKLEKEAFETRKKHEIKLANISLQQELANIAVQAASNPANAATFGLTGLGQYAALAAIALARHQGTISTINAQQFAKGGLVMGNSHAMGGEKFSVGGRVVELEGGEAVINRRSTAMFGGALSAMNQAGGGTSFTSPNIGGGNLIDYEALGSVIASNTNVVLPVETLNKTQNRVKMIERNAKF